MCNDHLPGFLKIVCEDSLIARNISCARKKTTSLMKNVIGPYRQSLIAKDLVDTFYSLIIIDETTDVSVKQYLTDLVRY